MEPERDGAPDDFVDDAIPREVRPGLRRMIPLAVIACGFAAFFLTGMDEYVSFERLAEYRSAMLAAVDDTPLFAGGLFVLVISLIAAFAIPAVAMMNVFGGFLFGPVVATGYAVVGQTIGATVVYFATRTALREYVERKAGKTVRKVEAGFRENAFSYMITLRLIPVLPAWLVNFIPGVLGVPLRVFVFGTLIGAIPCTFLFATIGQGLAALIEQGKTPTVAMLLRPEFAGPLAALMVLALSAPLYRSYRKYRRQRAGRGAAEGS